MDYTENSTYMRTSQLRQPSKIPSPNKPLFDISDSSNNARATATTMLPPPPKAGNSLKHKSSALPEPPTKRPTLVERAGEPIRTNQPAPASSRPISATVKATSLAGARPNFSASVSSISSRATSTTSSASSRNISNSSFASSVGSGIVRPPSSNGYTARPQSVNFGRPGTASRPQIARPASAYGSCSAVTGTQESISTTSGKRNGMTPILISTYQPHDSSSSFSSTGEGKGSNEAGRRSRQNKHSRSSSLNLSPSTAAADFMQLQYAKPHNSREASSSSSESSVLLCKAMSALTVDDYRGNAPSGSFRHLARQRHCSDSLPPPSSPSPPSLSLHPLKSGSVRRNGAYKNSRSPLSASFSSDTLNHPQKKSAAQKAMNFGGQTSSLLSTPAASTATSTTAALTPLKTRTPRRSPQKAKFLTRDTWNTAFDPAERLEAQDAMIMKLKRDLSETDVHRGELEGIKGVYEMKINELLAANGELIKCKGGKEAEVEALRSELIKIEAEKAKLVKSYCAMQTEMESLRSELSATVSANGKLTKRKADLQVDLESVKAQLSAALKTLEDERRADSEGKDAFQEALKQKQVYIEDLMDEHRDELESQENESRRKINELREQAKEEAERLQSMNEESVRELEKAKEDVEREKAKAKQLQENLAEVNATIARLEAIDRQKQAKIDYLESDGQAQAASYTDLSKRLQDALDGEAAAKEKLRHEEQLIRNLRNQVQELKGNIRVFCRVRPALEQDQEPAKIVLPDADLDAKQIEVQGPEEKSSLGTVTTKTNAFAFDRVFGPRSDNGEVFEEISQLVQSALDGYNVCIFCYGQTGAGKTHTMSAEDGMIPRALRQIYDTARKLEEEKGWRYTMEGSFVEVYNESLNDLLGKAENIDKTKHEIRHDPETCRTTVTDLTTVVLDGPARVEAILRQATKNRTVAATKANERSSRSHCVFILRLTGVNAVTGEKSEGTLNLVDLAGSERLSQSGATGERLKETQSINRSLSCLGDVIGALGQAQGGGKQGGEGHVPYRNSKLTYLLKYSLGGNSKTLMFVMVSPLQAHLSETLTSLKFATKVSNTYIGTARKRGGA